MEYAEAMSQTPPTVTDEMSAALLEELGAPAVVELTARVGAMNLTARANVALGIRSQEFSAACGLRPLATPSADVASSHDRRPVRRPPQPAVHRRLRDARLGGRRRGRRAGDLAAVGRRGPAGVRDPRAYLVRIITRQALDRLRTLARRRGLRRPVAARAAADGARRGRGRRAGRERLDGDAAGAGDADADRAGGVRAARGVRPGVRRDRRAVDKSPPPSARSPTGRGHTSPRAAARGRLPRRDPRSDRGVPARHRNGRPAAPARRPRAGRRRPERRWRSHAGPAARRGSRQGGTGAGRRPPPIPRRRWSRRSSTAARH